ncbi:TRAP transporter substrate-binding protein [Azospirillum sp. SYSU D00513]|uniref:TRAP transporter substrate-binding protein n=1 Tax=Azospirillum sp. SYSU D00513 TaxID=2812561 RepID=UPI001A96E77E|nr:TRAP transporter substrate-binding protein [Azospirillum sp. SYSU D00513]
MVLKAPLSRRAFTIGAGAAGLGAAAGFGFAPAIVRAQSKTTLKLGHLGNEDNVWHKAAVKFSEEVAQRTNGAVEVRVFPNEQLGKETDLIKGIQLGTVDFTITGESLQNWAPTAALLAVPYAIRDLGHLDEVVNGAVGQKIAQNIEEKTQLRTLAYFARGARHVTSNRPIRTPEDMADLKMRVPNVPLFVKFWDALGAKPTPMAFSEVFTALQNHTIEAQENPLALIKSASFFEVQKYLNQTEHVISWIYLVGGAKRLGRLSADKQQAISEAAKAAQAHERQLFLADEKQLEADLKAKGMEFVAVDKEAFARKGRDAIAAALDPAIKPLYEEIIAG